MQNQFVCGRLFGILEYSLRLLSFILGPIWIYMHLGLRILNQIRPIRPRGPKTVKYSARDKFAEFCMKKF